MITSLFLNFLPLSICYLLLRCPRLSMGPRSPKALRATCPFRDKGLTLPAAESAAGRKPLGIVSPKGSCFVQFTPFPTMVCIQRLVHGNINPGPTSQLNFSLCPILLPSFLCSGVDPKSSPNKLLVL